MQGLQDKIAIFALTFLGIPLSALRLCQSISLYHPGAGHIGATGHWTRGRGAAEFIRRRKGKRLERGIVMKRLKQGVFCADVAGIIK